MYPQTIYLYYVDEVVPGVEPVPRVYVRHYPAPIRNQLKLQELIATAAQEAADLAPADDHGFGRFEWRQKSFVVIIIDADGWTYDEDNALVFKEEPGKFGNHTFFNAFHPSIEVVKDGAAREVSVLCFTNWMATATGKDLVDDEREEFVFDLNPMRDGRVHPTPIDPGGTNLGPPVPPP
jgi:hypothetical protein